MKNKIILVGLLAVVLSACADGMSPPEQAAQPSASCGVILQAYKLGGDASDPVSGEIRINKGEGIVLAWSVSSLVSGELTSIPTSVIGQAVPLVVTEKEVEKAKIKVSEGSREFGNLQEDKISFTITAVNEEKDKGKSTCEGHLDVITTAAPTAPVVTSFSAKATEVSAGESTDICFESPSADVSVTIKDGQGKVIYPVEPVVTETSIEETSDSTPVLVAAGKATAISEEGDDVVELPPAPQEPKETCVTVKPDKTTTYTLTAVSAQDETLVTTKEATVRVAEVKFEVAVFTANGVEGTLMLDKAGEVRLDWEVTPAEAVVTIDNGVGQVKSKDSTTVKVDKAVTYTLTASLGDKSVSKQVTISIAQLVGQNLTANLTSSAVSVFAGEEVSFTWAVTGEVSADAKYVLDGPEGRQDVTGTTATVKPSVSGSYSLEALVGGVSVRSNQVRISVREWSANDVGSWGAVAVAKDQVVVAGARSNKPNAIQLGRLVGKATFEKAAPVDFGAIMKSLYFSTYKTEKLTEYGTFPVNAISHDSESGRLYAAVEGALLFSDNGGKSWDAAALFRIGKGSSVGQVERSSCKGSVQKGSDVYETKNLQQVCDVVSFGKKVIVGADYGAFSVEDIDKFIADRNGVCWQGIPELGCSKTNELSGTTVHALKIFGGDVFAGTAKGVWVSKDQGATWAEFNGGDVTSGSAVYSLAVDVENKTIYAGGPDGVFSTKLGGGAEWKKLGFVPTDGGVVYSLAVDGGSVYVGAEKGVFVSRNAGEKWSNVTESMGSAPTVYGLAISKSGSKVGIYAATSGGVFSSVESAVSAVTAAPAEEAPAEEPTVTPEPAPAPATSLMKSMF